MKILVFYELISINVPLCLILFCAQIVNAFGEGKKARRQFEGFYNTVMASVERYRDGERQNS